MPPSPGRVIPALLIVRTDDGTKLGGAWIAPANEVGSVCHQLLQSRPVQQIVAISQQDDSVGLSAVLIINVPVVAELLKTDEQVIFTRCAGADHRAEHREVERVDQSVVRCRVLKEEGSEGACMAPAQPRRILVHLVVELLGGGEHSRPGFGADRRIAAQRT